ncbi:hypothetical protein SAMN04487995_2405 [Dyadobacter koreensis]|uniref:Uncharacterized protein n=1 Tax=Dyadobacter koreensis TaxID=408657 RepID=A0A1H6U0V5_9BACT|nr:hypothetical protein SAMN04487995_2405 [Dyadobacter koreensis]
MYSRILIKSAGVYYDPGMCVPMFTNGDTRLGFSAGGYKPLTKLIRESVVVLQF